MSGWQYGYLSLTGGLGFGSPPKSRPQIAAVLELAAGVVLHVIENKLDFMDKLGRRLDNRRG